MCAMFADMKAVQMLTRQSFFQPMVGPKGHQLIGLVCSFACLSVQHFGPKQDCRSVCHEIWYG